MKKIATYLIIGLLSVLTSSFVNSDPKLIGKWKGADEKEKIGELVFEEGGYAYFILEGHKLGGKEFMMGDVNSFMIYETNTQKKPFEIDFIIKSHKTKEELKRLTGIYSFLDSEKMKIRLNFNDNKRPKNFEPKNHEDIIILTRVNK